MHPTVKPVAMLADAIRDVTKRGAIVLDPFAGSGSTLIAAEKTGRQARCIEYEPKYCAKLNRLTAEAARELPTGTITGLSHEPVASNGN
jgi:DNA modification methylase